MRLSKLKVLNVTHLKIIAMLTMLVDHVGFFTNNLPMRMIGRIAFPIFAFQISEGFSHTKNKRKYILKLLLFAIISEIPFNLFLNKTIFYPHQQNVVFTLLFGLLIINCLNTLFNKPQIYRGILSVIVIPILLGLSLLIHTDYEIWGVLIIVIFYLCKKFKTLYILQFLLLCAKNPFSAISMLFILMYNGGKGSINKPVQTICYWFYPLHMLILSLLFYIQ